MRRFVRLLLLITFACSMMGGAQLAHAAPDTYADGLKAYRAGQYAQAYRQLLPLARKQDARAMYLVGIMYQTGRGVPQDDATAAEWHEASAKLGDASGQYALARMVIEGRGVVKSRERGIGLLRLAAAQGQPEATALLTRLGVGPQPAPAGGTGAAVPAASPAPSITAAPIAFAPAATSTTAAGKPAPTVFTPLDRGAAQASMGALRSLLQRLAAADDANARRGLPFIALDFARQYWHVESVGDVPLANEFARTAREFAATLVPLAGEMSASQQPEAQAVAGLMIRLAGAPNPALLTGCPATIAAAQSGFAFAWFQGARCIAERDASQAGDWMRAAAVAGHAGAQESVGRSCIEGGAKNWPCAIEWLGRAARAGRTSAMAAIGWTLANQPAAEEDDYRQAMNWYERAAMAGDVFAMNNLAALLERGPEILRNASGARRWYGAAARTGFAPAQYNLGRLLAAGIGGAADRTEAAEWLRKAAATGVPEASAALEQLDLRSLQSTGPVEPPNANP